MAPKRKKKDKGKASTSVAATPARVTRSRSNTTRGTRSATRQGKAVLIQPVDNPEPRKRRKMAKTQKRDTAAASTSSAAASSSSTAAAAGKTVIIEHSKEISLFKKKANEVKKQLKKEIPGVKVVVNPVEPRKGCFEIREEDGEIFVSLVDMVTPFEQLKALNVEDEVSRIVQRLDE